jgi:23S rRNA pseudouridine1911/1915/1917 synthase
VVKIFAHPRAAVPADEDVVIRFSDRDLLVVEKPAGMTTLRHAEEQKWDERRRQKQPTLEEVLQRKLARQTSHGRKQSHSPRVRPVHRLDRDTSGLMLFALSLMAEQALVHAFKEHSIRRSYLAVVHGTVEAMTIESSIARDRGDGLRGTHPLGKDAPLSQHAVTHVKPVRSIAGKYTLVECRLETGRTHQIRIHLAESGHMLCGERMYVKPAPGQKVVIDHSGAPRQALHSAELEIVHPMTGKTMRFSSPLPSDLQGWLERIEDTKE